MITENNIELDAFIKSSPSGLSENLCNNLIAKFGGIEALMSDYASVRDYGVDSGHGTVVTQENLVDFFNVNKDELLAVFETQLSIEPFNSITAYVHEISTREPLFCLDNDECGFNDVAHVLATGGQGDDVNNDCLVAVSTVLTWIAVEQFAIAWEIQNIS